MRAFNLRKLNSRESKIEVTLAAAADTTSSEEGEEENDEVQEIVCE